MLGLIRAVCAKESSTVAVDVQTLALPARQSAAALSVLRGFLSGTCATDSGNAVTTSFDDDESLW